MSAAKTNYTLTDIEENAKAMSDATKAMWDELDKSKERQEKRLHESIKAMYDDDKNTDVFQGVITNKHGREVYSYGTVDKRGMYIKDAD